MKDVVYEVSSEGRYGWVMTDTQIEAWYYWRYDESVTHLCASIDIQTACAALGGEYD